MHGFVFQPISTEMLMLDSWKASLANYNFMCQLEAVLEVPLEAELYDLCDDCSFYMEEEERLNSSFCFINLTENLG